MVFRASWWLKWCRIGFDPWVGTIPWRKEWQPTPVFLPGESHGQRSLAGYSPWGHKESDRTEQLFSENKTVLKTQIDGSIYLEPLNQGHCLHGPKESPVLVSILPLGIPTPAPLRVMAGRMALLLWASGYSSGKEGNGLVFHDKRNNDARSIVLAMYPAFLPFNTHIHTHTYNSCW